MYPSNKKISCYAPAICVLSQRMIGVLYVSAYHMSFGPTCTTLKTASNNATFAHPHPQPSALGLLVYGSYLIPRIMMSLV